ncbi:MAG TPA: glycosyltransferase [Proteiniclasticum sp.]|nr:glycosyltransferase [Proteiniclasticum sp.]
MKALILSVSTGGGHGKAAEAIKESILLNEPDSEVRIIDTIKYISPFLDKLVVGTYLRSIRHYPSFFKYLYKHSDEDGRFIKSSSIGNDYLTKQLYPTILEFEPDIIFATHAFTAQVLSILRKKFGWQKPSLVVMTDYASHAFWVHRNVDAYVVSNEDMVRELVLRGRDAEMIFPYGIPISHDFFKTRPKNEICSELNISPDKKTLTIMGGSLGIGNIEEIIQEILTIPSDFQVIVLTGSNIRLYNKVMELSEDCDRCVIPLHYCDNMNDILSITDLLITKPGGLTITESFITGTPLAIYTAIPGHEVQNADYLFRHRLAINLGTGEKCGHIIENALLNDKELEDLKTRSKSNAKPEAAQNIYALARRLISEKSDSHLGKLMEL